MRNQTKVERRIKHIRNLSKIIGESYEDTKVIYKDLRAIEMNGHRLAEKYCNGDVDSGEYEQATQLLREKLLKLIRNREITKNIQFNGDPRGYFLKFGDEWVRQNNIEIQTDWGGYGILCPSEGEL